MKMRLRILLLSLLMLQAAGPAFAIPKPRPFTGDGLLVIRPLPAVVTESCCTLPVYREPGVERIIDLETGELPSLAPAIVAREGEYGVAVTGRKGNWLQIAYDDAGREGWLEISRHWDYVPWNSYLKGRGARLLPGLKKEYYLLRGEPSPSASQLDTLSKQKSLRVIDVREDWALVLVDLAAYGWVRWRDGDGRFLISIDDKFDPQKH